MYDEDRVARDAAALPVDGVERIRLFAGFVLAALLVVLALTAAPVHAAVYDLKPIGTGKDTSPYAFVPSLVRGNYEMMYAQTALDENQISHDMITYLEFELPPDLLQPGETVIAASLFMVFSYTFSHDGTPPPPGGELYVHEVTGAWDDQTMTWNNKPGLGDLIGSETHIPDFGSYDFDVTQTVRLWAHGVQPNHGFAITNPTDVSIGFHTWEANVDDALYNHLVIVTGQGNPPPSVPVMGPVGAVVLMAGLGAVGVRRAADGAAG